MGQKTNPNIFRLGKTKTWNLQYFEKKPTETPIYTFKNLEIKNFIHKFFNDNGLNINSCKIYYLNENSLNIFVSYYLNSTKNIINSINKNQKIKFYKNKIKSNKKQKYSIIKNNIKNYTNYKNINYFISLQKTLQKQNYLIANEVIKLEKRSFKIRRLNFLKSYKKYLTIKNHKNFKDIEINKFITKCSESLHLFINKKINISLTLQQLNKKLKQKLDSKKIDYLKKKLVSLKKYEHNIFFKEGLNILFIFTTQINSNSLLAKFIATQLQKLKRHNFFLRFIKSALLIFIKNTTLSNLQGVKIKIKGRFNGAPRAKHKIINVGKGVPNLKINANINYSEEISYTSNGTFGVKIWTYEK